MPLILLPHEAQGANALHVLRRYRVLALKPQKLVVSPCPKTFCHVFVHDFYPYLPIFLSEEEVIKLLTFLKHKRER